MNWIERRIRDAREKELTHLDLSAPWRSIGREKQRASSDVLTKLPREILELPHLVGLDLSYHALTELPPEICNLENLQELSVDSNHGIVLPGELDRLTKLRRLDLSAAYSSSLADLRLPPNLQHLDLSFNNLASVPEAVAACGSLTAVHLYGNKFITFPPSLLELPHLDTLALRCAKISRTDVLKLARKLSLQNLSLHAQFGTGALDEISGLQTLEGLALQLQSPDLPLNPLDLPQLRHLAVDCYSSTRLTRSGAAAKIENFNLREIGRLPALKGLQLSGVSVRRYLDVLSQWELTALRLDKSDLVDFRFIADLVATCRGTRP